MRESYSSPCITRISLARRSTGTKEQAMTMQAGLWIDHRKAVIVMASNGEEVTRVVESNVERHVRYSGGAHSGASHESQPETGEDTRERHFEGQLTHYYDAVIACIRGA